MKSNLNIDKSYLWESSLINKGLIEYKSNKEIEELISNKEKNFEVTNND